MRYPTLIHHGAVNGVTGSCHQVQMDDAHAVLIDCGLFQGAETSPDGQAAAGRLAIDFPLKDIKALILTHVHIDHVGRIPYLLAAGYAGPILCSEPSARLLPIVLEDAFKLGFSRDQKQVERYLRLIEERLVAIPYKQWFTLTDSAQLKSRVRLQRAGHILGSAYIELDLHYPTSGEKKRLVFSGDLGAPYAPILPAPKSPYKADVLVIESTYGDCQHEDRRTRRQRLEKVLEHALSNRGTVLIPAFSIGRTQELLYELEGIIHQRRQKASGSGMDWANLPIILDSPLASRFTRVYRELDQFWDAEARERLKKGRNPLAFANLLSVDSHAAHEAMVNRLTHTAQPAIVIAGNGMCSSGRIINYLKAMLGDERHDVLFVGYQAEGSPGRQIQRFGPQGGYVLLDGQRYEIRAQIHTIGGYSAHADQKGLLGFVARMRHWPQEVRVVHGDAGAKQALANQLGELYRKAGRSVAIKIPESAVHE
ncbi:MBL fold metallo-hydrolase RNA specificity domain-containing protein [Pseudomonas sp. NCCP-436]|uniref:MBL fold metallo-hydrolase RNA specificity domain-containing protein n=1 Tax=Pseudomonas sp. NCCP-436 TaxID=2842481 RepID=UPI001C80DCE7|nr:MBL fold metallo-hydrolase [Pseudomonas sp. NCCP-436]GIZ11950.1 MBL fold hydrolase [Pseudomonas sp. NCCP-436]